MSRLSSTAANITPKVALIVTGWARFIKLGTKVPFLNIIDFDNIQSTSLEMSEVVGILSLKVIYVEGSTS